MNRSRWTITRRITAALCTLLALLVITSALSLTRIAALRGSIGELADSSLPAVVMLGEISRLVQEQQIARGRLLEASPEEAATL